MVKCGPWRKRRHILTHHYLVVDISGQSQLEVNRNARSVDDADYAVFRNQGDAAKCILQVMNLGVSLTVICGQGINSNISDKIRSNVFAVYGTKQYQFTTCNALRSRRTGITFLSQYTLHTVIPWCHDIKRALFNALCWWKHSHDFVDTMRKKALGVYSISCISCNNWQFDTSDDPFINMIEL